MTRKEFRRKWLSALESGKYKRCKGKLRRGNKFCCLGVACDVLDKTKWEKVFGGIYAWEGREQVFPERVMKLLGLDSNQTHDLVEMNDYQAREGTFKSVAKRLREMFKCSK